MTLAALALEVLREQRAWHGTLALDAWREALGAQPAGWALQWHYRLGVLSGWLLAGLPPALLLGWRRWQGRAGRDALEVLAGRSRRLTLLLAMTGAAGAYLAWPAPLPPPATPWCAALLLLAMAGLP
ncbi:MAG: hypothetical protein KGL63_05050 [Betaproteobacteria bacterium]|nr:hypothetical protein [Betaproteobacteria bacterium]